MMPWVDPALLFARVADEAGSILMESQPGSVGRYSMICAMPFAVLEDRNGSATLTLPEGTRSYASAFDGLRGILANRLAVVTAGYLGYELHAHLRDAPIPVPPPAEPLLPYCWLGLYDSALIFDHRERSLILTCDEPSQEVRWREMISAAVKSTLETPRIPPCSEPPVSGFSKDEYLDAVRAVKSYIASGDIYQANLSQRFTISTSASPWDAYLRLRETNPAPYAAYLNVGGFQIVSSSPECFLTLDAKTCIVETRPIKGTRPRGASEHEDQQLAAELITSEKDQAENVMIVDLERNDIGRVCEYGSVEVPTLAGLESHPTVHHLVSTVKGRLRSDCDPVDLIEACFPGGSITGAPKIRAMEIIAEVEPVPRYVYTGSIGWLWADGSLDLSIVIRTAVFKDGLCYLHVGGGIVADSDPDMEYQETLDKGRAFFEVLGCTWKTLI
jgi:para-aminobenzoate synthetase component 1